MQKRNIKENLEEILELSTMDIDSAISCFYVNFSDGKPFTGVSVRLAEIIASTWGNIKTGATITKNDGKYIYVKGFVNDIQKNSTFEIEILRSIVKYNNLPMSGEELQKVSSAACSIAFRNAVLKAIPTSYINPIINKIKSFINDNVQDDTWKGYINFFKAKGISEGDMLKKFSPDKGVWDDSSVILLIGFKNAVDDGDAAIFDLFPKAKIQKKSSFSDIANVEVSEEKIESSTDTSFLSNFLKDSEEKAKDIEESTDIAKKTNSGTRDMFSSLNKEETEVIEKDLPEKPVKRGRGRPRKNQQ
jgi:hypothetical protein